MLLGQIDASEKLDPEVEDILMDIADDFVESVSNQTNVLFLFIYLFTFMLNGNLCALSRFRLCC